MTNRFLLPCGILVLAGLLPGQAPQAPPGPPPPPALGPRPFGPRGGRGGDLGIGALSERRLTLQLGLSAEQQNKVHTAVSEARVLQQGMAQKEGDLRTQLAIAVKAGNEAQIDTVSQQMAQLHQQRMAIHAKALAKVYSALTADQRTKVDGALNRSLGVPRPQGQGVQAQTDGISPPARRLRRGPPGPPPPSPPPPQQQ